MASNLASTWDGLFDGSSVTSAPEDPRFTTLVTYDEKSDSFEVNEEGVRTIFSTDKPLRVHACIGHYPEYNSNIISKILEYAMKSNDACELNDSEDLTELFLKHMKGAEQKCIVAWSQLVPGKFLEGKRVNHVFLNIVGDFEADDPVYLVMAGICTAICTSVVHIQKLELQDDTWMWTHKVALVASKVLGNNHSLGRLVYFVPDWAHIDRFNPGEKGGREYLAQDFSEEGNWRIQHVYKLFENITCYLFPVKTKSFSFRQHLDAFKQVILYGDSGLELNKSSVLKTAMMHDTLSSLEQPESYIMYIDDPAHQNTWNSQEANVSNTTCNEPSVDQDEPSVDQDEPSVIQDEPSVIQDEPWLPENNNQIIDQLQLFPETFAEPFEIGSFLDTFDPEKYPTSIFISDEKNAYSRTTATQPPQEIFTFQEYMRTHKRDIETENSVSREQDVGSINRDESVENPPPLEDLLARMNQSDSLQALESQIHIPFMNIPDVPFPNEGTQKLSPGKSPVPREESTASSSGILSKLLPVPTNPSVEFENTVIHQSSDIFNSRNDSTLSAKTMLLAEILTLAINYLSSLTVDGLCTVSVNETLAVVIKEVEDTKDQQQLSKLEHEFLHNQLTKIFNIISSYTEKMDHEFKERIYFDTTKDLMYSSKNCLEGVLRRSEIQIDVLPETLRNSVSQLEFHYIKTNDTIRTTEAENADCAINLAVEMYKNKLSAQRVPSVEELAQAHDKLSHEVKEAFSKIYGGSDETTLPHLETLGRRLNEINTQNQIAFQKSKETEAETIRKLITQIVLKFGSEMSGAVMRNASISTESQFMQMSQTCKSNSIFKFADQISSLSSEGKSGFQERLNTELYAVNTKFLTEFRARKHNDEVNRLHKNYPQLPTSSSEVLRDHSTKPQMMMANGVEEFKAFVGIRFGFDQLAAVTLVDGQYRTIYGPASNTLVFTKDEVIIGKIQSQSAYTLQCLKNVLEQTDFNKPINIGKGHSYPVEEILAMTLSQLHLIVTESLHTDNVAYAVAVPSCFNSNMTNLILNALQIAGMRAIVIKEASVLLARLLYEESSSLQPSKTFIAIIENTDDSADAVQYDFQNRQYSLIGLAGYNVSSRRSIRNGFLSEKVVGLAQVMDHLSPGMSHKSSGRIILECTNNNASRNASIISNKTNWNLQQVSNSKLNIAEGAALTARYKFDPAFKSRWDERYPRIQERSGEQRTKDFIHRLEHTGQELDSLNIAKIAEKIQTARQNHKDALHRAKEQAKSQCMQVLNSISDNSNLSKTQQDQLSKKCSDLIRKIGKEPQSITAVHFLLEQVNQLQNY